MRELLFCQSCSRRREVKNKYIRSQILDNKFREVLKYLAKEIEATKIANLTGFLGKIFGTLACLNACLSK